MEVARAQTGLLASITAKGRLQLGLYVPIPATNGNPAVAVSPEPPRPVPNPAVVATEPVVELGAATPSSGEVDGYQVVLLIHGIRTTANWGPMVRSKLEVPGQVEVIPIRYGYFDAFRFWFPFWTRSRPVEKVYVQIRVALQKYRKERPDAKLSIIAHSFGTYVVGQILKRGFDLQIHRLILCGSVLRQDFPWEQYQGRFDDDKVVNECGKADIWPVLAQSASWGYGASGTHGFGAVLVKDRFHAGGHGQYFEPEFVEYYWDPFIKWGEYRGTDFEVKMPTTPLWVSVLGILPLRWLITMFAIAIISLRLYVASSVLGTGHPNEVNPAGEHAIINHQKIPADDRHAGQISGSTEKGSSAEGDRTDSSSDNLKLRVYNFDNYSTSAREVFVGGMFPGYILSNLLQSQVDAEKSKGEDPLSIYQYRGAPPKDLVEEFRKQAPFICVAGYVSDSPNNGGYTVTVRAAIINKEVKSQPIIVKELAIPKNLEGMKEQAAEVSKELLEFLQKIKQTSSFSDSNLNN
ncbi:alpha/beta hydrolase [Paludisphaera soli]|uniref:alpha/beta hydrolase n=1 Tax=Paludisphaera soli TaxID=2712865 RepID=UPI0013EB9D60|nr:alpha/beta hydrolase [Paludisphaera soli]